MGVKEILGYICFAGAVTSFVTMYLRPVVRRRKAPRNQSFALGRSGQEQSLIRIEEASVKSTGLMIPLQLILMGLVLLT